MAAEPSAERPLRSGPTRGGGAGPGTGLVTRIVIVVTIIVGQLFALTAALEESLLDKDGEAWLLAGFSLLSFIVVLVLTRLDPAPRAGRSRGQEPSTYVSRPAGRSPRGSAHDDRDGP